MTASSNPPKSSPYHRFIPREEVQAVSVWEFPSMDGKAPRSAVAAEPPPAPEPAAPELPAPDLDLIRKQAYDEGFEQGRIAGAKATRDALDAPLRRTAEDAARRLSDVLRNAQAELERADEQLAAQMLQLACDLARQVVRRELEQPQEVLKAVIAEALAQTVDDHLQRKVKLNPVDLALMQNHLGDLVAEGKVQFVAQDTLSAGGCVVETNACTVDASIEKRWARAVANLGLQPDWNPAEQGDV
jgi:flagellar assembly protein FliH